MTEAPQTNEQGPPQWRAYLFLTTITLVASIFGGCVNRQQNNQKHEQMIGRQEELNLKLSAAMAEIRELRLELSRERNRP